MSSNRDAELYELFWENSKLNQVTIRQFRARTESYAATVAPSRPALQFATPDVRLERPHDRLAKLMEKRRSVREFSEKPLPARKLGSLFASFGSTQEGSRTFASAGATYPLEVFCLLNSVEGPLNRTAVYYNHDNHSLSTIAKLPNWSELAQAINLEVSGVPHLVFVFVLFPERATAKYGERGGRFALIEVGHAAQALAVRLVHEGMVGCEAGGLLDGQIKTLLGLDRTSAQIALGYVCGLARSRARSGSLR
jgi:SagB-type dehydrogenase family enzyme